MVPHILFCMFEFCAIIFVSSSYLSYQNVLPCPRYILQERSVQRMYPLGCSLAHDGTSFEHYLFFLLLCLLLTRVVVLLPVCAYSCVCATSSPRKINTVPMCFGCSALSSVALELIDGASHSFIGLRILLYATTLSLQSHFRNPCSFFGLSGSEHAMHVSAWVQHCPGAHLRQP
jgi:hypothetical protein